MVKTSSVYTTEQLIRRLTRRTEQFSQPQEIGEAQTLPAEEQHEVFRPGVEDEFAPRGGNIFRDRCR
jgi:hypothetical protein